METKKTILALVGMPGAGKSEAAAYIQTFGIPFVRFGEVTDEGLKERSLPVTPDNEKVYREQLRRELGMAAYAIKAQPKIEALLQKHNVIALDGLYSWEEYVLLKEKFPFLLLIHIYAEPQKRYGRLAVRKIRPIPYSESYKRDVQEIEKLNKGGPIAIADYLIENNENDKIHLYEEIDTLLTRLAIKNV